MPNVKIRRKPLWTVAFELELKDGTRLGHSVQVRFDPGDVRDSVEGDPIDTAIDELFADARLEEVTEDPNQLREFHLHVTREEASKL